MPCLFLHIGFPKTSTTTLQHHYFPDFPGYFGKDSGNSNRIRHLLRQGFARFEANPLLPSASVFSGLEVALEEDGEGKDVLVSDEALARWRGSRDQQWPLGKLKPDESLDTWPTPYFLSALRNFLGNGGYTLKVMLVIRRQQDLVPSLFAHSAQDGRFGNGIDLQKSLEQVVRDIADSENPWFDFARLGRRVADAVGEKNLLVSCYEFGPRSLAIELASFAGLPPPSTWPETSRLNVRKVGDALWVVTGPERMVGHTKIVRGTTKKAEGLVKAMLGPKSKSVLKALRFQQMRDFVYLKPARFSRRTFGRIEMTAELRRTLRLAYMQSNLEVAADWRLLLGGLGYLSDDVLPSP